MPLVTDTHSLVWYLTDDPKLAKGARAAFERMIIGIPRKKVPDPWDRLIAATAMHLNLPLISRDPALRNIGIEIVWE